ncbi:hypothetical protein DPMN_046185 [Dreissena polymorpha]|uniref:Uncharacterized protein n=1 Tax=Dreissena polymorpha TaxID=45954 RepID=A0A9D4D6A9_DREPO|nr:hypothetical protein DPMN_046185 [Dreissena polymorpha]
MSITFSTSDSERSAVMHSLSRLSSVPTRSLFLDGVQRLFMRLKSLSTLAVDDGISRLRVNI